MSEDGPELEDDESLITKLEPETWWEIDADIMADGWMVEFLDADGYSVATLNKYPNVKSYNFKAVGGAEQTINAPFSGSILEQAVRLKISLNGDFSLSGEVDKNLYSGRLVPVAEPLSTVDIGFAEYFNLTPNSRIQLLDPNKNILGTLKINPGVDAPGRKTYTLLKPNGSEQLIPSVFNGRILDGRIILDVNLEGDIKLWRGGDGHDFGSRLVYVNDVAPDLKIVSNDGSYEPDRPEIITGVIDGDKQVAMASYREVGVVKEGYVENDDCAGFAGNKVVVADGIGSILHSKQSARYATELLLQQGGTLREAIEATRAKMDRWLELYVDNAKNHDFRRLVRDMGKVLSRPNTVMAALRFDGDIFERLILGDCVAYFVRGDKVFKSREYTVVNELVTGRKMSRRQAMASSERSIITTELMLQFKPDISWGTLKHGDRIVLISDGMKMNKHEIHRAVAGKSPTDGVNNLLTAKYDENNKGGGIYYPGDAGEAMIVPCLDNGTVAVVAYD